MSADSPCVSIGLAVYNGEKFIREAIDSILAQTYLDFELIISDNASTDKTEEICRGYAEKDNRIRYSRNETNIGGANNENLTFRLSRGKYFRWAAHDDVCAPELISRCVEVLDRSPIVVLCYAMINEIDESGNIIRTISQKKGLSTQPSARFRDFMRNDHNCEATYGLIRSDILRSTRLEQNYTDSDRTLLCELSLHGQFYEIEESLFYKRYHPQNMYSSMRARMAWFNPAMKGKIVFPFWMQFFDYLITINRVPLPFWEKIRCYFSMTHWFFEHAKNLAGDLIIALVALVSSAGNAYGWRQKNKDIYNWE